MADEPPPETDDEPCTCGTPFTCLARHDVEPPLEPFDEHTRLWADEICSPYKLCEDPECEQAYAFRDPFPELPHYHYIGPKETTDDRLPPVPPGA